MVTQTFITTPPTYSPVYNIMECCLLDTDLPGVFVNYRFVLDLNWDNGDDSGTKRFYAAPHVDATLNQKGFQEIGRYLESKLKEKIVNPEGATVTNGFYEGLPAYILSYTIDCYQGWDVAGVFTVDPEAEGAVSTATLYAWSGVFEHHDWIDQMNAANPYISWLCNVTNGTGASFLSADPSKKLRLLDIGWTYYMTDTLIDIDTMHIRTYDIDGTPIAAFIVDNANPQTEVEEMLSRVASAPASLNAIPAGQVSTGVQPIVTSAAATYTIQLKNTAGTAASEILTFTIEEDCRYEVFRIHFQNNLGGFDAYNFRARNLISTTIERKQYTKAETIIGVGSSDGIDYFHSYNGTTDYMVKYRDKVKLKSEYLTDTENVWLKELITSPQAYWETYDSAVENKILVPVYITAKGWIQKENSVDKLFQLDVTMELAHQNIRQRR